MTNRLVRILKADEVSVTGNIRLGIGSGPAPVRIEPCVRTNTGGGVVSQQARVVESNSEYAIIELICSCGGKNYIQCNYGQLAGS